MFWRYEWFQVNMHAGTGDAITKDWDQEPSTGGWWVYPFAVIDEFAGQNELEAAKCSLGLKIKITWQNRRLLGLIAAKGSRTVTWETPSWMTIWTSVSVKPFPSWSSFWSYFWETMRSARYPFRSLFAIHFWKVMEISFGWIIHLWHNVIRVAIY